MNVELIKIENWRVAKWMTWISSIVATDIAAIVIEMDEFIIP